MFAYPSRILSVSLSRGKLTPYAEGTGRFFIAEGGNSNQIFLVTAGHVIFNADKSDNESVRREPISKSCEMTQADNLNRRRRLSRKAQCFLKVGRVIKIFLA